MTDGSKSTPPYPDSSDSPGLAQIRDALQSRPLPLLLLPPLLISLCPPATIPPAPPSVPPAFAFSDSPLPRPVLAQTRCRLQSFEGGVVELGNLLFGCCFFGH